MVGLIDQTGQIWELLLSGFFACQSECIKTLDEIIPLRRSRERFAHDGWEQPAEEGPQAKELALWKERVERTILES